MTTTGTLNIRSTGTTTINNWSTPELLRTNVYNDRIEILYKQTSNITFTGFPSSTPEPRIYKIVFSCVDGKWNQSEPIFGNIVRAREEYYEFED